MSTPTLPRLTPDCPDFQAVMDAAFDQVAFADPDGMELPGDVLYALRGAVKDRFYLPDRSTYRYLRSRGIRERRFPGLARRKFYVGLLLHVPYDPAALSA
ncbi:hypothetical protein ACIBL8_41400 [Streptomyces sp. NPDC050523]|uniref:hypothetical protein n=1 Tax=Streptomyces sp. NPDC050523 TaxID=3365622 RepID=UPI0037933075